MTRRQFETLNFIRSYIAENEIPPSYDEIAAHLNLHSKSGVHRVVKALVAQGKLTKTAARMRSLAVVEDRALRLEGETAGRLRAYAENAKISPAIALEAAVKWFLEDGVDS